MKPMSLLRFFSLALAASPFAFAADYLMYVGTYTGPKSKGIYAYRFDAASGRITSLGLAGEAQSPSFLAIHPGGGYLYSANETEPGTAGAFRIDRKSGKLTPLNHVASQGSGPCAIAVDPAGKNVLVANYTSGSVALLPVKPDGSLGEASATDQHKGSSVNRERQEGPHAHSADFAPGNRFALVADLGLDKIFVYRYDAQKGTFTPNEPAFGKAPAGSGPRHVAFHPNGKFAYSVNELNSTVTAYAWNGAAGTLKEIATVSALAPDFKNESDGAEIHVHPSGRFVYSSNRGQANSIALFRVDPAKGTLEFAGTTPSGGNAPRYFGFDPTGAWLLAANQDSDNIVLFRIDPGTGKLTPTGQPLQVSKPVCIKFVLAK
jgi:6-phosphogluconolactonase